MRNRFAGVTLLLLLLSSCSRAPAVDVLGSYFPIWIFCILLGVVATVLAHQIMARFANGIYYGPPVLIYPSLVVFFACLAWLLFFR